MEPDREGEVERSDLKLLARNIVIEVVLYSLLVVAYVFLVLRLLGEPLKKLFDSNLVLYAFVALALIVVQGAVLETITSFLLDRLRLERLE